MTLFRSLANLSRRLFFGLVLALLSVAIPTANIGCAAAGALVVPTVTCFGINVSQADVKRAVADLWAHNWSDLEALAKKDGYGWPVISCIIGAATQQNPQLKPAASEFRRLHAVEFRAAESSNRCSPAPYTVAFAPAGGAGPAGDGGARLHAASMRGAAPPAPIEAPKGGDRR